MNSSKQHYMVSANDEVKHLMDFEPETEADFIANMSNR